MKVGGLAWRVFGFRWFAIWGEWWFPAILACLVRGHPEEGRVTWNGDFCGRCGGAIDE